MRKLGLVVAVLVVFSVVGCCSPSPVLKKNIDDLEDTHKIIFPEYISLVEAKYAGDDDKIKRRKDLVGSAERKVDAMQEAVKD
jgi:hypothetical protein